MNINDAEDTVCLRDCRLDDPQHRFYGDYPLKWRRRRPKQLDRNRVVGDFHRGVPVYAEMGYTAFSIFVLAYTVSTSVGIIIYYRVWINAVRVAVNVPVIVYSFKALFEGKFK